MTKDSKEQLPKSSRARRFLSPRVKKKQAHSVNSEALPRITNDTVSKHREEVLSGAKKYIYPLRHSRHRVVIITVSLLVVLFIGFATYTLVNLYKLNNTSAFMYQITKVVPLPVGRIGKTLVGYDDYLFEIIVKMFTCGVNPWIHNNNGSLFCHYSRRDKIGAFASNRKVIYILKISIKI